MRSSLSEMFNSMEINLLLKDSLMEVIPHGMEINISLHRNGINLHTNQPFSL